MYDIRNEGLTVLMEKRANVEGVDSCWKLGRARVSLDIARKENEKGSEWGAKGGKARVSTEKEESTRDGIKEAELGACSATKEKRDMSRET